MARMKQCFDKRDYPQDLVNSEMEKVQFPYVENKYSNSKEKRSTFVVTFHPLLKSLGSTLNKNYFLLEINEKLKRLSLQPTVSFRSARKLSSYLVWAELYPVERKVGSCKYNCNRYQVCQSNSETDTFTFSNDGTSYKINHKFDCNKKCLIFLTASKKCFKQYIGQTVDAFKSPWNNH